jgi:hypothetical protein
VIFLLFVFAVLNIAAFLPAGFRNFLSPYACFGIGLTQSAQSPFLELVRG